MSIFLAQLVQIYGLTFNVKHVSGPTDFCLNTDLNEELWFVIQTTLMKEKEPLSGKMK